MTSEECNKIIAEYMGIEVTRDGSPFEVEECIDSQGNVDFNQIPLVPYTDSLDALVPVWDKLKEMYPEFYKEGDNYLVIYTLTGWRYYDEPKECRGLGATMQQAAAISTAKAIQELNI